MPGESHPSAAELMEFANGKIAGERWAEIESHVEQCDECCDQLSEAPTDKLLDRLSQFEFQEDLACSQWLAPQLGEGSRYEILSKLGQGGMGTVYKARHKVMQRVVAIKVVRPELVDHPEAVKRFAKEAKLAARLSHPNIVTAHDAEMDGQLHFLVMEYVDGESLYEIVNRQGPLPQHQACDYIRQAANGLQHALENDTVHRDLKPQNLMLTADGTIKILDFGLSKFRREQQSLQGELESTIEDETILTLENSALGTQGYISPEQSCNARQADIRSDIFSLGCTLFFLLTNRPPFLVKTPAHPDSSPDIRQFRPDLPENLALVLEQMMAHEVSDRFQTPNQVAEALEPFCRPAAATDSQTIEQEPVVNSKVGVQSDRHDGQTNARPGRRRSIGLAVVAMSVILLLLFIAWLTGAFG